MSTDRAIATTVDVIDSLVRLAALRGDGEGMLDLRHRLRAVLDPPQPATASQMDQASVDLEHEIWVAAISEVLLPEVRDAVVAALHDDRPSQGHDREVTQDVWIALDPVARETRDRAVAAGVHLAQHAAIGACRRYERTRRTSHLRLAVRELESAERFERAELASGIVVGSCDEEADRLGRALRQVLPPSAFRFFATAIRKIIGAELAKRRAPSRRSQARGAEQQRLLRDAWTDESDNEERAQGVWFIQALQDRYDKAIERNRLAEEAEARRRRKADADFRKSQARRDEEARSAKAQREQDGVAQLPEAERAVPIIASAEAPHVIEGAREVDELPTLLPTPVGEHRREPHGMREESSPGSESRVDAEASEQEAWRRSKWNPNRVDRFPPPDA